MNANLVHNVLNVLGLLFGALVTFDWTSLNLTAEQAVVVSGWVLMGDKIIKLGMNLFRDGPTGLWKAQIPVRADATVNDVGTVKAGPNVSKK
jgi:hypothetical protein